MLCAHLYVSHQNQVRELDEAAEIERAGQSGKNEENTRKKTTESHFHLRCLQFELEKSNILTNEREWEKSDRECCMRLTGAAHECVCSPQTQHTTYTSV